MSKLIVDTAKWRIFEQTLSEIHKAVADIPPEELQSIIDEATDFVRAEMREEFRKQGA